MNSAKMEGGTATHVAQEQSPFQIESNDAQVDLHDFEDYFSAGEDADDLVVYADDGRLQLLQLLQKNNTKTFSPSSSSRQDYANGKGAKESSGTAEAIAEDARTFSRNQGENPRLPYLRPYHVFVENKRRPTQSPSLSEDLTPFDCPADWEDGPYKDFEGASRQPEEPDFSHSTRETEPTPQSLAQKLLPTDPSHNTLPLDLPWAEADPCRKETSGSPLAGADRRNGRNAEPQDTSIRSPRARELNRSSVHLQDPMSRRTALDTGLTCQLDEEKQDDEIPAEESQRPASVLESQHFQQSQPGMPSWESAHLDSFEVNSGLHASQRPRGPSKAKTSAKSKPKFSIKPPCASGDSSRSWLPLPPPPDRPPLAPQAPAPQHGKTKHKFSIARAPRLSQVVPEACQLPAAPTKCFSLANRLKELTGEAQPVKALQPTSTQHSAAAPQGPPEPVEDEVGEFNDINNAEFEAGSQVMPSPSSSLVQRFREGLAASDQQHGGPTDFSRGHIHRLPVTSFQAALQRVIQAEKQRKAQLAKKLESGHPISEVCGAGALEVQILNTAFEANLTKCFCELLTPTKVGDHLYVLFVTKDCNNVRLEAGRTIGVYPPWKEIQMSDAMHRVVMCTTSAEILPKAQ